MSWHYINDEQQNIGPVSEIELADLIAAGKVKPRTMVWHEGMDDWKEASASDASTHFAKRTPPPPPPPRDGASSIPMEVSPPTENSAAMREHPSQGSAQLLPAKRVSGFWIIKSPIIALILLAVAITVFRAVFIVSKNGEDMEKFEWMVGGYSVSAMLIFGVASIGALLLTTSILYHFAILHRAWSLIPADQRTASPAKTVALLFVPLFNFYWIFRAYWGLARSHNRLNTSRESPRLSPPLFLVLCLAMNLPLFIPAINMFALPVALIAGILVNRQLANFVNHHALKAKSNDGLIIACLSIIPMTVIALTWVAIIQAADDSKKNLPQEIPRDVSYPVPSANPDVTPAPHAP